jgi:PAS domain S-box-containing protein
MIERLKTLIRNRSIAWPIMAVALAIGAFTFALQYFIETNRVASVEHNLKQRLDETVYDIKHWASVRSEHVERLAKLDVVRESISDLLPLTHSPDALIHSPAQLELRRTLGRRIVDSRYLGYFLISKARFNLASLRNSNIGTRNLLAGQDAFFKRLDAGKTALSRIVRSDVPLPDRLGRLRDGLPTAFVGAPVTDDKGKVLGYLTARVSVATEFADILAGGRIGLTGESYAFDRQGLMLSESLFESALQEYGLLKPGQVASLNLRIRDPGANLADADAVTGTYKDWPLTRMAKSATAGHSGTDLEGYRDYRGVFVVGAWRWLDDLGMGVATELERKEAYGELLAIRNILWLAALSALVLSLIIIVLYRYGRRQIEHREGYLQSIMDSSGDGIITVDLNSRIETINKAGAAIFGYEPEDLIGGELETLLPEVERFGHARLVQSSSIESVKRIAGNRVLHGLRKDGSQFPIELNVSPMTFGSEPKFVGVVRDISERMEAEKKIVERERTLSTVLDTSPAGIALLDEAGIIRETNVAWGKFTECLSVPAASAGVGSDFIAMLTYLVSDGDGDADVTVEEVARLKQAGRDYWGKLDLWERIIAGSGGGGRHWFKVLTRQVGHVPGTQCVVMLIDISEIVEAQEKMRAATEEAMLANEAKSRFLASMSHELRTPLNGIIGMVDLIGETGLDGEQRGMVDTIHHSANALLIIINDILDLVKIETGAFTLEAAPVSPLEIVESVGDTMWLQAATANVGLLLDPALEGPRLIQADPNRLRQILAILISNAIKFSGGRKAAGKVRVSTRFATNDSGDPVFRIMVEDNGIGMSDHQLNDLFKAFTQADDTATRRFGGIGLGLTICRHIVGMMNGRIDVESEEGIGSRFCIELPYSAVAGALASPTDEIDLAGCRYALFIADDELADLCTRLLVLHGGEVERFPVVDGGTVSSVDADAILAGPEIGAELVKRFSANATGGTPVVRFSSDTLDATGEGGHGNWVLSCHPMKPSALLEVVAAMKGRRDAGAEQMELADAAPPSAPLKEPRRRSVDGDPQILVAEDNAVNRRVITMQLRKLGYTFDVAEDGREALEMWRGGPAYALLLTDCHMPNMDGLELSREIRRIENEEGASEPIPIVAVTANALAGEAERCIAAGMNDFLSKPVGMKLLQETLAKWMPVEDPEGDAAESADVTKPFDFDYLAGLIGAADETTIIAMLEDYREVAGEDRNAIERAASAQDIEALRSAAHAAKESARLAGSMRLGEVLVELHLSTDSGDWSRIEAHLNDVRSEYGAIEEWFEARAER